ncbi:thioredoxin [Ruminococcus sp.]|uniref:thioredoxin n=1 Tax=Ruminococcus sp. TaxID=41978 RepID=UPI0025F2B838|nr:thioredoxin [Ruminococcus sp.]MCR4638550.1 thioredoxin [Ruminococcus sp.]
MREVVITKENFQREVLNYKDTPVLLDFWAMWCAPCMALGPIIEQIADKYDGEVKVGKVNVDEQPELASAFRVDSIPMLAVLKDGQIVNQAVGLRPEEDIVDMFRNV